MGDVIRLPRPAPVIRASAPSQQVRHGKVVRLAIAKARRARSERAAEQRRRAAQQDMLNSLDELRACVVAGRLEELVFVVRLPGDVVRAGASGVDVHGKSNRERKRQVVKSLRRVAELIRNYE